MAFRDDLTALASRHAALDAEVATKEREVAETRTLLDQAKARARLPVLDNLRVAAPCNADWNKMTGDERARLCGDCAKTVYNISGLTRDEAETLLIEKNGDLCVRYFQRTDGTILLADCEIGTRRRRRKQFIAAGAAALLAGTGVVTYSAMRHHERETIMGQVTAVYDHGDYEMGRMAVQPPKAPIDPQPTMGTPPPAEVHEVKGGAMYEPPAVHELKGKVAIDRTPAQPHKRPAKK